MHYNGHLNKDYAYNDFQVSLSQTGVSDKKFLLFVAKRCNFTI